MDKGNVLKIGRLGFVVSIIMLFIIASACGNNTTKSGSSKDIPTMKVGLICGGMTPLLTQIGMNDGSFEKAGINVEKVCFTAGADAVQALVGGSIDVNLGSYEHVLRQQKNGLDVKVYGEIFNGVGYALIVKQDSPFQSLADLKGETLAVTKIGSLSYTGLRAGLEDAGVDVENDVQIINGGSGATMLAAIESGNAAGGMVSEPTISQMLETGDYRILYDPPFEYAGITVMAKTDWANKNKDTMKTFLRVNKEINDRTQKDPKSALAPILLDFDQVPEDVLQQAIVNQLAKVPEGLKITKAAADMVVSTQVELGEISKEIPFEDTVDLTLLP